MVFLWVNKYKTIDIGLGYDVNPDFFENILENLKTSKVSLNRTIEPSKARYVLSAKPYFVVSNCLLSFSVYNIRFISYAKSEMLYFERPVNF